MKIHKLKINAFGNIENKEIELSEGINVVYGKNEAGKSTLLKFIVDTYIFENGMLPHISAIFLNVPN